MWIESFLDGAAKTMAAFPAAAGAALVVGLVTYFVLKFCLRRQLTNDAYAQVAASLGFFTCVGAGFGLSFITALAAIALHLGLVAIAVDNRHPWGAIAVFLIPGAGDVAYVLYCVSTREQAVPARP